MRDHARVEHGHLQVRLEPGSKREDCNFWISTDDEEITVGFGIMFHEHFGWPVQDNDWQDDPIEFIRSLMSDEILIEEWTLDGKWTQSSTLAATEQPDLNGIKPGHVVYIRSWSGTHDQKICGE